jgi:hypothetical protein
MKNVYRLSKITNSGTVLVEAIVELEENPPSDVQATLNKAANEAVLKRLNKSNRREEIESFPLPLSFSIEDFPSRDVEVLTPGIPPFIASSGAHVWITKSTWQLKPDRAGAGAW